MHRIGMAAIVAGLLLGTSVNGWAQESTNKNKFRQLKQELATPNVYRTASGAPGHEYYQQRADYDMQLELDDEKQRLYGTETVTYYNNSPDPLTYLWVQLDQNRRAKDSDTYKIRTNSISDRMSFGQLNGLYNDFDGGFKIDYVKDAGGRALPYTVNQTMMRIDLPTALKPGGSVTFKIKWWYNINDRMKIGGRSGYEYFEEDDNYLYTIAQFFPRMAVYNEVEGWQNKQFLGRGEFALVFGNYKVSLTVPADHVVAATGVLQNPRDVLTAAQRTRMDRARAADKPVLIVT
ncbi:MAG: M1 family peptidase, partial [Bacteroidota bacterium]